MYTNILKAKKSLKKLTVMAGHLKKNNKEQFQGRDKDVFVIDFINTLAEKLSQQIQIIFLKKFLFLFLYLPTNIL